MIFGWILDGLPPPEHSWDLLAAAGGSQMPKSVIFDRFGSHLGSPGSDLGFHFGVLGGSRVRFLQDLNYLFGNIVLRGFLEVIFFDFS